MPIFEFKCSKCEAFFEVIVMGSGDDKEINCPECKSKEFQRVVSTTNYTMGSSGSGGGATRRRKVFPNHWVIPLSLSLPVLSLSHYVPLTTS